MNAKEYMERKCLCGHKRDVHMHGYAQQPDGVLTLVCVPCGCCGCRCLVDEFELELGGDPMENKHLGPLAREAVLGFDPNTN